MQEYQEILRESVLEQTRSLTTEFDTALIKRLMNAASCLGFMTPAWRFRSLCIVSNPVGSAQVDSHVSDDRYGIINRVHFSKLDL